MFGFILVLFEESISYWHRCIALATLPHCAYERWIVGLVGEPFSLARLAAVSLACGFTDALEVMRLHHTGLLCDACASDGNVGTQT